MALQPWKSLINKKVVAFRGIVPPPQEHGTPRVALDAVLFDDNETFLEFGEQDPHDYHDCCGLARIMAIEKNADLWKKMFDKDGYDEPNALDYNPFF